MIVDNPRRRLSTTAARVLLAAGLWLWPAWSSGVRAEPDEAALGQAEGYPAGDASTMHADRFMVGSFSGTEKFLPTRRVARGGPVTPLPQAPPAAISYVFEDQSFTLADYLKRQRVTGLLVLKDGQVVAEHYRYGRRPSDRFVSFSMAKSVNSLLIGTALEKGMIASLDDPAANYVPELKGSLYGQATIRQLLRMSSGVKFVEKYDGRDDIARLFRVQFGLEPGNPLRLLASFRERDFPAGEKFSYCSAESVVLGYVLARAAGRDVAALTSQWLWQPLGAEADAAWNLSVDGQEQTQGWFNATLRDYARLGMLLARDGELGGRQIVPRAYLLEATSASSQPPPFRPRAATPDYGYGYQFWLLPGPRRSFAMLGVYGQAIFVQPESRLVMVHASVFHEPVDTQATHERHALWRGVVESLAGGKPPRRQP